MFVVVWDILDNNQTLFLFKIVVKQDQEYLKPSVVHALANAELYCLALAHIYADPNYSQLNHWGVIQALNRKGVYVAEPSDVALTETTLIHTSPLRMVIKVGHHSIPFRGGGPDSSMQITLFDSLIPLAEEEC